MKNFVQRFFLLCLSVAFSGLAIAADIPNNTIYYTSTDGDIVTPYSTSGFGANIVSNTYANGQGIITFDGEVTSIGSQAFSSSAVLKSITIPNSVTSIGDRAFSGCSGLTSIRIPNSVTYIGKYAFFSCISLTSIQIPNSVTYIGNYAFENSYNLKSVTCLAATPPTCGDHVFYKYKMLHVLPGYKSLYEESIYWRTFTIADDVINESNAIYYTSSDGKIITPYKTDVFGANIVSNTYENGQGIITFDGDVTTIGESAFFYSFNLATITIPNSVTSIGSYAFSGCSGLTSITIPNSVTFIGAYAFRNCSGLTSITIPNSIEFIGYGAFWGCSSLTTITIPNSVTSIGDWAFSGCSGLTSITIPNSVTSIGNSAFSLCSGLTTITIPNSVTSIGEHAFSGCPELTSITIPNSVTSIGKSVFSECISLSSITVEQGNTKYDCRNNCNAIIETATNTLIAGCKNTIIPNSVASIGSCAFHYCKNLTSITIPNSVTSIESHAFVGCSKLKSITIPNSVTSIGNSAFWGCSSLTTITIPNSVTSIGSSAFSGCSSLASITIPNSVTNIGNYVFDGCSKLTSITNLSTTPQRILPSTFSKYGTLHVLPGCKEAYQNADYWKNFTIVEDADVIANSLIELADGKTYNGTATQENKDITYTRTFNNTSWQSLYIPFSMTYDDWKDDFEVAYINGIRQMDTDDDGAIDETIMDIVKIKSGSLIPNTPYLIKAKSAGNKTITVNDATLYKAESNSVDCSTTIAKYTFTGTYSTIPAAKLLANNYYAMGGGSLIMTDGTSDLKPFRWYLNVESRSPMYNVSSGAKAIKINVVGEENTTGITQYANDSSTYSKMYDINGRIVNHKSLKPGLYIKNGKKIIVK